MRALSRPITSLLALTLGACATNDHAPRVTPEGAPPLTAVPLTTLQVEAFARDYPSWGALDQPLRVAPTLCRAPAGTSDPTTRASEADSGPHGRKLYRLHARDAAAYRGLESGAPQAHQVLVKEAFEAVPFVMPGPGSVPPGVVPTEDGLMRVGAPAGLFVMFRGGGDAEGEHLWTYATVDPSGAVTAVGRLESCSVCHRDAPYGGLFGLER